MTKINPTTNTGAITMSNDKTNVTAATADETPAALKDLQAKLTPNAGKAAKKSAAKRTAMPELDAGKSSSEAKPSAAKKSAAKPSAKKSAAKKPAAKKPAAKSKETNVTATTTPPASSEYSWPKPATEVVFDYLRDSVQAEFDSERELRPYVNANGKLFIHSSDWIEWLIANGMPATKSQAAQPLRELGLVVRATPIPTKDYAKGFYQGALPTKVKDLPRRESRRTVAGPRATRNPFAKFDSDQRGVLASALANFKGTKDAKAIRDALQEQLTAANDAAATDTNGNA